MEFNDDHISFTGKYDEYNRKIYEVTAEFDVTYLERLIQYMPNEYLEAILKDQLEHENFEMAAHIRDILSERSSK